MNRIRISLLGKLQIQHLAYGPIKLETRRDQELFGYLLLNRQRLHEREKLAGLMWEESSTTQSKRNLRQTLWHIQSTLNSYCTDDSILHIENGWIGVNLDADFWLDVAVVEEAYAVLENLGNQRLNSQQAFILDQAVQLYQGDLLEGCLQDWCIYERERFQNMHLAMLDHLLRYSETEHDYERGLAYGAQILRFDRANEQTHRHLMRLYYLAGNRTAAIHQYKECITLLREELDVEPSRSTELLYHQICNGDLTLSAVAAPINNLAIASAPTDHWAGMLQELTQIQSELIQLQEHVTHLVQCIQKYAAL